MGDVARDVAAFRFKEHPLQVVVLPQELTSLIHFTYAIATFHVHYGHSSPDPLS